MTTGDIFKFYLESIVAGGDALGRIEGKPVFVPGGAPEEIVCCRITKDHKSWVKAELLEIIKPSPLRVDSVCAFYGKCGGCNLQHINYETQLKVKTSILNESFLRIGGLQSPDIEVFSSPPWEYRNRMQFHCFRQKQNDVSFGLKGQNSKEIIAVSDCPIAVSGIRKILKNSHLSPRSSYSFSIPPEKDRFTVFSKDDVLLNEGGQQKGRIKLLEKEILIDAGLFFQSNCFMLEKLIKELRKIAECADRSQPMADLYCGVGTFALFLGDLFPKIILAEENKNAVSLACENLRGINAEFFALRDTDWPKVISNPRKKEFGFAVIDPPRTGLAQKLALALALNGPSVLAYVSCDAASLARDAKILTSGGYKLNRLLLFDFYPQTAHIESLAVFKR
jgi:23S rRNA (uracil1939-C5)-methyltransferase